MDRITVSLTTAELELARELVSAAAVAETARVGRMRARPAGSHAPATIAHAARYATELEELRRSLNITDELERAAAELGIEL